jgi:hypothetical protein
MNGRNTQTTIWQFQKVFMRDTKSSGYLPSGAGDLQIGCGKAHEDAEYRDAARYSIKNLAYPAVTPKHQYEYSAL